MKKKPDLSDKLERAWADAPKMKPLGKGHAKLPKQPKPLRVGRKVFRAIIEMADQKDGTIQILKLDTPEKDRLLGQVIAWRRGGVAKLFRCTTKESLASRYRIMLENKQPRVRL